MPNIKFRGIVGELYNGSTKLLGLKDLNIDDTASTVDVSDHDSAGYGELMPTFKQVKASANFWYLGDSVTGVQDTTQAALITAYNANTILTLKFRPNGTATGKAEFQYPVRMDSLKFAAPTAGAQPFDVTFVGTGAPTYTVQ